MTKKDHQVERKASRSKAVSKSIDKFIAEGGKILPVRLDAADQSILNELAVMDEHDNNTSVVRTALRVYRQAKLKTESNHVDMQGDRHMKIISILNGKGGVGKTTLSISLADALAARGRTVVVFDTDKQQSTQNWKKIRDANHPDLPAPTVVGMSSRFTADSLKRSFGSNDYLIIDGPGGRDDQIDMMTICGIASADLVILPMNTSFFDLDQTMFTIDKIKERQELSGGRPLTRAIISRAQPSKNTYKAMLQYLKDAGLVKLETDLMQRTLHESLPIEGLSAIHSGDKKMIAEINAIADEVEGYFAVSS